MKTIATYWPLQTTVKFGFCCLLTVLVFFFAQESCFAFQLEFWEEDPGIQEPFDPSQLDGEKTGWVGSRNDKLKTLPELGFRSELSSGDQTKERETASLYVPQNWDWDWGDFWGQNWFGNWFGNWNTGPGPAIDVGFWGNFIRVLAVLFLFAFVVLCIWLFARFYKKGYFTPQKVAKVVKRKPKVEDLPFKLEKVEMKEDVLWKLVLENRDSGNYKMSIVFLYSYMLLYFDKKDYLVLKAGKTNRVYLGEVSNEPKRRGLFSALMFAFEEAFFGNKPLALEELNSLIQRCVTFTGVSGGKGVGK